MATTMKQQAKDVASIHRHATTTAQQQQQQSAISHYEKARIVRNSLIAGSVAGIASTVACHPFDVIRTKMQAASMSSSTQTRPVVGPLQVTSQTIQQGGLRALYTGLALPLAAQAVYKATIFTVNNVTQKALLEWKNNNNNDNTASSSSSLTLQDHFICGFVAGGVNAALFVTPVEYVRNQLIKQQSQSLQPSRHAAFTGPLDVVRHTIRHSGIMGLWKGTAVTVARDSIGVAFFFGSMQWCQEYHRNKKNTRQTTTSEQTKPSLTTTILSGAVAGLTYWIVALPLDSVKTWVQSDMADSAIQAVRTCLQKEGFQQTIVKLFAGFQVAYARGIPSAAITVTTYSFCYQALQQQQQ